MIARILAARALRAFADGFVSVILPAWLLALGLGQAEIGLVGTATLLGSALAILAVGRFGHRFPIRQWLLGASLVMAASGLAFTGITSFWPLLAVAFVSTLNPSAGDASVFLPLDHTILATAPTDRRTTLFARYSFAGSTAGAAGALASGLPEWTSHLSGWSTLDGLRAMFLIYAAIGVAVWFLYRGLPDPRPEERVPAAPLGPSRAIVWKLAALFSVDSFAGGLILNSLLALWLFERFGMSLMAAGAFFFWTGLLAAGSQLAAPWLARRIGLVNTMVWTHIPSSLCLILAALSDDLPIVMGLLLVRALLSQMDVPARSAFVMSVVTPAERPAAASFTTVPRSLASAAGPTLTGIMFASGAMAAPLVLCGALKIAYDLALLAAFRRVERRADADEAR